jgi:hypothetical protein
MNNEKLRIGAFNMSTNEQNFFSRAELSDLFRVTTQTLIRWEKAGLLTSVHLHSGSVRYTRQEVDRFILAQTEAKPTKRKNPKPETCQEYIAGKA